MLFEAEGVWEAQRYQNKGPEGVKKLKQAVHFLCLSRAKSMHALQSTQASKQAPQWPVEQSPTITSTPADTVALHTSPIATEDATATESEPGKEVVGGRPIRVSLCDPDLCPEPNAGSYPWSGNGVIKISTAMLTEASYRDLSCACGKYVPKERLLQEIRGAVGTTSEAITLANDEEVEAWLLDTENVQPLRVLAIYKKSLPPLLGPSRVFTQSIIPD